MLDVPSDRRVDQKAEGRTLTERILGPEDAGDAEHAHQRSGYPTDCQIPGLRERQPDDSDRKPESRWQYSQPAKCRRRAAVLRGAELQRLSLARSQTYAP